MKDATNYLSTAEVARALGVGVSTVKRWVDEEILPAYRTPGGHRKLRLADVLRLAKDGTLPDLDLRKLTGLPRQPLDPAELARELACALVQGDEDAARVVIHQAFYGGMPLTTLADRVIGPAMARVGHDWETGRIDVLHEHRGTQLCAGVLYELRARLEPAAGRRPVAVGGAPEDDPYLLTSLLIEMLLLEMGWDVVNLGPNTPLPSFEKALAEFQPRLLWVSASYLADPAAFREQYARLYRRAEAMSTAVAIGGQALKEELRTSLPRTMFGDSLADLAAFVKVLHPPPRRPRRGRPPGTGRGGGSPRRS